MTGADEALAVELATAAEIGFPGDRNMQIRQLSARGAMGPMGGYGVILRALQILAERAIAENGNDPTQ